MTTRNADQLDPSVAEVMAEIHKKYHGVHAELRQELVARDARLNEIEKRLDDSELRVDVPVRGTRHPRAEGFRKFFTPTGEVVALDAKTRLQDVMPREKCEISLERWLGAAVAGERCGDKQALEYARDIKSIATTTTGLLIPAQYVNQWIDALRTQMVLNRAGMATVIMDAKTQSHAALTGDPAASWHSEAGSINATDPTLEARTLTAQTLVTRCQCSVEVAQDSPDFGAQLLRVITAAFAAEIDRVGLVGSGTPPEPHGILGTSGVNQVTSAGTPSSYAKILTGVQKLLEANVGLDVATAFAIMSPRSWASFEGLATGITSDKTPLPRPKSLESMQFLPTTNVPNNLGASSPQADSVIFLGDFRDLVMGIRRDPVIKILELSTYATNLQLEIVGFTRVDFMLARPASFCTVEGVTA